MSQFSVQGSLETAQMESGRINDNNLKGWSHVWELEPWDASEKPNLINSTERKQILLLTFYHLPVRVSLESTYSIVPNWTGLLEKQIFPQLNDVLVERCSFTVRVNKYYDNTERMTESHSSLQTSNHECEDTSPVITQNSFTNMMLTRVKNSDHWWKTTYEAPKGKPHTPCLDLLQ